jgi:deoxyadenosine/deoxycytidine kinase
MKRQIFITGASGVGKTTLAKYISENYGIPYISASAKDVWPRFGFENHEDALRKCLADPILGFEYQKAIWVKRHDALSLAGDNFITDRSPIDNYAYYILQQGYYSEEYNKAMNSLCIADFALANTVIFIRLSSDIILENDGKRILNITYQKLVDNTIGWVLSHQFGLLTYKKELIFISNWDFNNRIEIINNHLSL